MVRFGTVVIVDHLNRYAIIRENTSERKEFFVMPSDVSKTLGLKLVNQVTFQDDPDFVSTPVATQLIMLKRVA